MNKLVILAFVFVLASFSVSAALSDDLVAYYTFDTDASDDYGSNDLIATDSPTHTSSGCILGSCYDYDGTNDKHIQTNAYDYGTGDFSVSWWMESDDVTNEKYVWTLNYNDANSVLYAVQSGDGSAIICEASSCNTNLPKASVDTSLTHYVFVRSGTNVKVYRDNVEVTDDDFPSNDGSINQKLEIAFATTRNKAGTYYNGVVDEVGIWDKALSVAEISELWNSGAGKVFPFDPPSVPSNSTTEQTSFFEQVSPVLVASSSYENIFGGDIEILNASEVYLEYVINILPSNANTYCRVLVNGTDYGTETFRTGSSGDYGVMFFKSDAFNLSFGNHSSELQCKKDGTGNFMVSNSVGIAHILKSSNGVEINSSFGEMFLRTQSNIINTSNFEYDIRSVVEGDKQLDLVVEGDLSYEYSFALATKKTIYNNITLNGVQCGLYERSGEDGDVGSGGFVCALTNVSDVDKVNLTFELQGSATLNSFWSVNSSFVFKEFILNAGSVNHSVLTPDTQVDSVSFVDVASITINNSEFPDANLVVKAGISGQSDSGAALLDFRLRIASENGSVLRRDVSATGDKGLIFSQWVFDNIGEGVYTVTLQGRCDNAACSVAGGDLVAYLTDDSPFLSDALSFSLLDNVTGSSISVFNVTTGGGNTFFATSGTATVFSAATVENLSVDVAGYFDNTFFGVDMLNGSWVERVNPAIAGSVVYSNYTNFNSSNYTRTLVTAINVTACGGSNTVERLVNGVFNKLYNVNCAGGDYVDINDVYTRGSEGVYNIGFRFNFTNGTEFESFTGYNDTMISDLYNPTVTLSGALNGTGFGANITANFELTCNDNITPLLLYNLSQNNVSLFYGNKSEGSTQSNITTVADGVSVIDGVCSDFFGSTFKQRSQEAFVKEFCLIDEIDNTFFGVDNISGVKLYFDDNSSFYDFKASGNVSCVNYTSFQEDKLRLELKYASGDVITRFIDVSLVGGNPRLCANKEGVVHYEQLVISATEREVILKSVFADCLIAADYTRFAYQDSFALKAFSIATMYYLNTIDGGVSTLLASVDGSIAAFINLDVLDFQKTAFNIDIIGEGLSFETFTNESVLIRYQNLKGSNVLVNATITNLDDGSVLLHTSDFLDPNEWVILFDHSTLNISTGTVFRIVVDTVDSDGNVGQLKRYFNVKSNGVLSNGLAFIIALLLTFFGFTFTLTKLTFSWFGFVILIIAIAVLGFAQGAWWITMMMGIEVILLIYVVILMATKNRATVG